MALDLSKLGFEVDEGNADSEHFRFLIYGDSGTGKTTAACLAEADLDVSLDNVWDEHVELQGDETVFVLMLEGNGVSAAKAANPLCTVMHSSDLQTTRKVMRAAVEGSLQDAGFRRLVIDGITELQQQILDDMYPGGPPKDLNWQGWNDATRRFCRTMASVTGIDIVVTALSQEKQFEEGKPTITLPDLAGRQAPLELIQYFNAAALLQRHEKLIRGGRREIVRVARMTMPERIKVKECRQVKGDCKPVPGAWAAVLRGERPVTDIREVRSFEDPEARGTDTSDKNEPEEKKTKAKALTVG